MAPYCFWKYCWNVNEFSIKFDNFPCFSYILLECVTYRYYRFFCSNTELCSSVAQRPNVAKLANTVPVLPGRLHNKTARHSDTLTLTRPKVLGQIKKIPTSNL